MTSIAKKKLIAFILISIFVISTLAVGINYDNLKNFFSEQEEEIIPKDEPLEEEDNQITKNVKNMLQQLNEEMITGYIKDITDFGPHVTARQVISKLCLWDLPIEKVRKYIGNALESMGYNVRYQEWKQEPTIANFFKKPDYSWGWFEGVNIEATIQGKDVDSDEIYLLLAHYDAWPKSPGADDDASGVAAILAAAKLMRQYEFNHTVRFVLVDGEEQGLLGSNAYAEEAVKNNDNIEAAFVLDMIGNRGPKYRDQELLLGVNDQTKCFGDFFVDVNNRYSEFFDFTVFQDNAENYGSDHKAFIAHGLRAVYIAEAVDDPDWHTPHDTLERMDIDTAVDNSKLILATIAELAWDVDYE